MKLHMYRKCVGPDQWIYTVFIIEYISSFIPFSKRFVYEPVHEISNNVVCATSKASDQTARTQISLPIRAV